MRLLQYEFGFGFCVLGLIIEFIPSIYDCMNCIIVMLLPPTNQKEGGHSPTISAVNQI